MKRGTPDHPKVMLLAARLRQMGIGMPRAAAVGTLEMLWQWAAQYTPQGDIGRWPDEVIEEALGWTGEPGALLQALCESGWVDEHDRNRLILHDWPACYEQQEMSCQTEL